MMTGEEIVKKLHSLDITGEQLAGFVAGTLDDEEEKDMVEKMSFFGDVSQEYQTQDTDDPVIVKFDDHNVLIAFSVEFEDVETEWTYYDDFKEVFKRRVIETIYETAVERGNKKDEA